MGSFNDNADTINIADILNFFNNIVRAVERIRDENSDPDLACSTLEPLALSMLETINLYSILFGLVDKKNFTDLFDGNETITPNIDTRLKYIRDLVSASKYVLKKKSEKNPQNEYENSISNDVQMGEFFWYSLLKPYLGTTDTNDLLELSRLLDDIFESMIVISDGINSFFDKKHKNPWNEILRQIEHIRDHFDYAETHLISCLQ